jgi:phosphoribosylamine--glycine ligase
MKILIVGNGGREHTLLWKLRRDAPNAQFFATRPNGGMAPHCTTVDLAPDDPDGVAAWSAGQHVDLVVVGPEAPLAAGMANALARQGIPCFGPTAGAARIESSKAFSKDLMERAGIPSARFRTFTASEEAQEYIRREGAPIVVKASGLAAGKGAIVCMTLAEALEAAREMLEGDAFGEAGAKVVVEEFMEGEELSVFALSDGTRAVPLLPSQDHKRVGEGDTGPNTGGMGAYAPVSIATPELMDRIQDEVLEPTLSALKREGSPFRGLLYAGLMLSPQGPRVVEFNCRFGDPETQVVLPLMDSSLLDLMEVVARGGSLEGATPRFRQGAALTTVLASEGYPGSYPKGRSIRIPPELEDDPNCLVFHAGTAAGPQGLMTSGGRVLAVTGLGESLREAADRSRAAARSIEFEGSQFRADIGWRELARQEGGAVS